MIFEDDRTEEQKETHCVLIAANDSFLSGWANCKRTSMCAWAVKPEDADDMEAWVRSRGDMKYVRIVGPNWKPRNADHVQIYVANRGEHRALPVDRRLSL